MERDGVKREDVINRANRQIDEEIKMRLCDFVIVNNDQELVIPQVLELHDKLTEMAAPSNSPNGGEHTHRPL
jgi:dephospho-CoA kinase